VSLDGFVAGPRQSREDPLGVGGERLHLWMWETAYGREGGATGVDDAWLRRGDEGIGATVMGRNMFGPVRGPWPDDSWRGWWGEDPPYRHDVFVLTHHARASLPMDGGTTFHFVTDGLRAAVDRALEEQQRRAELLGRRARRRQQGTRMAVALRLRGDGQRAEHEHVDEPVGCVEPAPRQPDVTSIAGPHATRQPDTPRVEPCSP
jgi:dihydrofolate reductase